MGERRVTQAGVAVLRVQAEEAPAPQDDPPKQQPALSLGLGLK